MAKTREEKKQIVADLVEKFRTMKAASFSAVSGFTMDQANELREKAAESGVEVFIAKKTLLGIAAKEAGLDLDPSTFEGSILTAVSFDDQVAAAKLIKDFSEKEESLTMFAGVLEGRGIGKEEVNQLAQLPNKEELLAKLVGSINAPVSGFVNVLAGNMRGLMNALNAIKETK